MPRLAIAFALCLVVSSCDGSSGATDGPGVASYFALDALPAAAERFFDFPYPSDLRLGATGAPDLSAFPNPRSLKSVSQLRPIASDRRGFPVIPVAFFRFHGALARQSPSTTIAADPGSPVLLLDIEPGAPARLHLYPLVAETPETDAYIPEFLLSLAPRPGIVLRPGHRHAFVVRRALGDSTGMPLAVDPTLATLAAGGTPEGARGDDARALYLPLWQALDDLGVPRAEVVAATVFTTGDVVKDNADLSSALVARHPVTIDSLAVDLTALKVQDRFCELKGTLRFPQFQPGAPPFNTDGVFVMGNDGLPVKQRDEEAPLVITIPRQPMPPGGYPLVVYFHGSGGLSTQVADYGRDVMPDVPEAGKGPAYYFAEKGIAAAATALPVNPERLPGASETAYLNVQNLAAFRDTFRQGLVEQRLFIDHLVKLSFAPSLLGACTGPSLPPGVDRFSFNPDRLMAQGQSMGGMYTNLVGAVEPRIKAVVPTGAGGYWSYFLFSTHAIDRAPLLLATLLGTDESILDFLHPTMMLLETAVEAVDPMVSMVRLGRRPLPGHPARPIYQPTPKGDSYFDTTVYDAMVLAYGNQQAGAQVWSTMQPVISLEGNGGLQSYPVRQNRISENGSGYTGVAVQYAADGNYDPHSIYRQLDAVKYQYGCFYESFLATGTAIVAAPGKPGDPCPK